MGVGIGLHGSPELADAAFYLSLGCTIGTFHHDALAQFLVETELGADAVQTLQQADTLGGQVDVRFSQEEGGGD
ncbi:MAG: hypothetical protein J6R92_02670 [Akkermansia sp.]|nr:hypothetical protein [Akkermansia sp.]